ncbi:hypothetical protein AYO20_01844 [Fonsecaea nubica]|uniref:Transcription factor domain-containing protein n=1 Tax=Fonsecaea nubica TaxID=856822 RepID=A0A178D9A2_9EURO|nr:hypothetical protein AYO20_01844 [Fonsecaea nubica]OAL38638.1 hypothetical protein AYO20_01844 [Fonsecaea nubica]
MEEIPKQCLAGVVVNEGPDFHIEVVEVPVPEPGPYEVLIKLNTTGLCMSDVHYMLNDLGVPSMSHFKTRSPGHEGAGVIVKVGAQVTSLRVGQRAGIKPTWDVCHACDVCLSGRENYCKGMVSTGLQKPGSYQQYIVSPERYTALIPDGVSDYIAGPVMCSASTMLHSLKTANLSAGQWAVFVGGGGGVGLQGVQLAYAMGLRPIVVDTGAKREELSRKYGAEHFVDFRETKDAVADVVTLTDGGAHGVFVTAIQAYPTAMGFLGDRVGGRLMCIGLGPPNTHTITLDPTVSNFMARNQSVTSTIVSSLGEITQALDFAKRSARSNGMLDGHIEIDLADVNRVRCSDRILPRCSICLKTQQECDYPSEAARPGPKLGTTRRKRPRSSSREKQRDKPTITEVSGSTAPVESADGRTELEASTTLVSSASVANGSPTPTSASFKSGPVGDYPLTPVATPLDVRTLAFIMHPSHETSITLSNMEFVSSSKSSTTLDNIDRLAQACALLKVPANALQPYLDLYFDNMTSFSLFHRPTFAAKLCAIDSIEQLAALLASIFSFSARYRFISDQGAADLDDGLGPLFPPKHFEDMALRYVDQALAEYSDRSPPLCVLQALVLNTFSQLIKGVRGAAWRRLGICVRVAYELDLHHIDRDNTPEQQDPDIWCRIEECRRAWWAIWEMDNFASLIRRCPTAVDGTDNETRFPVADEEWFALRFTPSCFLETKPMERLKALQHCSTQSSKAWFLVLDSLMREGHRLSKFRSPCPGRGTPPPSTWSPSDEPSKDNTESLQILANALRCFSMALPKHLRYRDGFLSFAANDPAVRQLHSAKYSIHVTTQLTRMMIHHQDAYHGAQQDLHLTGLQEGPNQDSDATSENESLSLRLGPAREGMQQFIEAADELLRIVSWSSEEHVRYVNPFLASTIWYGAVVHLGWKVLAPPSTNLDWVESKFTVLHMILMEFSEFWDLPKTLQENLASVEGKLRLFKTPKARRPSHPNHATCANRDRNTISSTNNMQSTILKDRHAGGHFPAARSSMAHNSAIDADCLPNCNQDDGHSVGAQQFLPARLDMNPDGRATASNGSGRESRYASIDEVAVAAAMGGMGTKDCDGHNDQYTFDESCISSTDMLNGDGNYGEQATNNYQTRGLWDDLTWDLDFAMDPRSLFRGIMDYNN